MNDDEIFAGVRAAIAEVLDKDDVNTIALDQRLVADLGADSLDLLDLVFHLERRFKITINPRDIERQAQAALGETPIEIDGFYTPAALAELRKAMPEVPPGELADNLEAKYLPRVFRVSTFVRLVKQISEVKNAQK